MQGNLLGCGAKPLVDQQEVGFTHQENYHGGLVKLHVDQHGVGFAHSPIVLEGRSNFFQINKMLALPTKEIDVESGQTSYKLRGCWFRLSRRLSWNVQPSFLTSTNSFDVKTRDMWKENMITRSEIQTENTCSLGFWDIRKGVKLRRLILRSLKCTFNQTNAGFMSFKGNDIYNK